MQHGKRSCPRCGCEAWPTWCPQCGWRSATYMTCGYCERAIETHAADCPHRAPVPDDGFWFGGDAGSAAVLTVGILALVIVPALTFVVKVLTEVGGALS